MNLSKWFQDQLQASAEGFIWSTEQVPKDRQCLMPPEGLGEWSTARHIFHMMFYEKFYALQCMRQWLGETPPSPKGIDEDLAWGIGRDDIKNMLAEFKQVRNEQIALLPKFDASTWKISHKTFWGQVPLTWVVSKTFQHTAEHTSDVMQIALFWDEVVKWNKFKQRADPTS